MSNSDAHRTIEQRALRRVQLSRARGWRMPPNTVKVDRTTKWGNPFIVGAQGNAAQCVYHYGLLLCGYHCLSTGIECGRRQNVAYAAIKAQMPGWKALRGKNLACWCRIGEPCHADLILMVANRKKQPLDLEGFLARYGWRMVNGEPERIEVAA